MRVGIYYNLFYNDDNYRKFWKVIFVYRQVMLTYNSLKSQILNKLP